jgi:DNA-binding response OmpR family regulator
MQSVKILLVEDDQATRNLLENNLILQGYNVDGAMDGQSAINLAQHSDYDLVVLDVEIPKIDGLSVCKHLRTKNYQMPILLLTAHDLTSDRVLGLDAGADDYMIKPFNLLELLARIRALLRRGSTNTSSLIIWGELQLDRILKEIRHGDGLLRLTPKEYGILELLLLNPQRILSRSDFLDRLWELEEPPTESSISSHIKALRQN